MFLPLNFLLTTYLFSQPFILMSCHSQCIRYALLVLSLCNVSFPTLMKHNKYIHRYLTYLPISNAWVSIFNLQKSMFSHLSQTFGSSICVLSNSLRKHWRWRRHRRNFVEKNIMSKNIRKYISNISWPCCYSISIYSCSFRVGCCFEKNVRGANCVLNLRFI